VSLVNRVGYAFIKHRMRKEGAVFGGEVSGHYYFRDFSQADSGAVPFLLMLELVSKRSRRLSEILAPYREHYFITGELNTPVADVSLKLQELKERYAREARCRTWTGSPSTRPTGTSMCARRTPSRCCGSTSRRARAS
jgi:phosphomannomutase